MSENLSEGSHILPNRAKSRLNPALRLEFLRHWRLQRSLRQPPTTLCLQGRNQEFPTGAIQGCGETEVPPLQRGLGAEPQWAPGAEAGYMLNI